MNKDTQRGQTFPLGATVQDGGVNFCVFSKNCAALELLLFDRADDAAPSRVIQLDPEQNKTYYYWHIFVPNISAGQLYGYRVYGQFAPHLGYRFDGEKVLIDPYARAVVDESYSREAAKGRGDNCALAMKSVVVDTRTYDWEGDAPLQKPIAGSVIYEMHVGGFTRDESSGVEKSKRGTYHGVIEKIPYLQELGVTTIELLPVQQFDEQIKPAPLKNYWGYDPLAFFAPHRGYSSRRHPLSAVDEFRDMVKALHRAGIEVILDIVFNHTAESDESGPTLSLRGFENLAYYLLDDQHDYLNYTGCGNTLNCNHSIVRRMIVDCLRYWVREMHVDGFRFDLASVMSRDEKGRPLENPPILWEIESDPILAGTKIIAEAWDAAGLYQVGSFIGHRWAEWNGRFRDDVRRFVRGDDGMVSRLAARLTASPDIYPQPDREPNRSINFVTAHDGFTLNDLVSYNEKHNEANEQHNGDGSDLNFSWNHGIEGDADSAAIAALRLRQIKNFLTILFVSQGTPMLLMGDEVRRTQGGNNNAYCQDNEISWFDWNQLKVNADLLRFTKGLIRFNRDHTLFQEERFWVAPHTEAHVKWHGVKLHSPDWSHHSHSLAFELHKPNNGEHFYIALNAYWESLIFDLPPLPQEQHWHRIVDTALPSPDDFCENGKQPIVNEGVYKVEARSSMILAAR